MTLFQIFSILRCVDVNVMTGDGGMKGGGDPDPSIISGDQDHQQGRTLAHSHMDTSTPTPAIR